MFDFARNRVAPWPIRYGLLPVPVIIMYTVPSLYSNLPLYRIVPYRIAPYRIVPYRTVPYRTVPYGIVFGLLCIHHVLYVQYVHSTGKVLPPDDYVLVQYIVTCSLLTCTVSSIVGSLLICCPYLHTTQCTSDQASTILYIHSTYNICKYVLSVM